MARLWQSGWELNSITTDVEWSNVTGAGATIQTAVTRSGGYAARTNPTAATAFFRYHYSTTNLSTFAYLRVYMRIAALPGANTTVVRFVDNANNQCAQLRLTATGTLVLLDAASNPVGSASAALSLNQWYRIELGLDASSAPGSVEARIDGATFASGANSAQAPWARVLFGPVVSATCDIYWDDAALNDNSGTLQNSWPGDGKILHLVPAATGDANAWNNTANGAGSTANWQLVSDVPPDDATTLVQSGTLNAEDFYNLGDSGIGSSDVVNVSMVGLRLRNNTADAVTAVKAELKKTSGGTILQGAAIVPNGTSFGTNAPAQPRNYTLIAHRDPDGNAWTQSTIDSAQAGVKITAAGTNRIQVSAVWVSVDYTPSTSTPVSSSDSGSAVDASSLTAAGAASDTGGTVDSASLIAGLATSDTAGAVENATVSLTAADSATAVDAAATAATVTAVDTAFSVEHESAAASFTGTDTATATDSAALAGAVTATETAGAAEASALTAATADSDTASSSDTAVDTSAAVIAADAASTTDSSALNVAAAVGDAAHADDVADQSADLTDVDAAAAGDAETVEQSRALTDDDAATAVENVHVDFGDGSTAISDSDQAATTEAAGVNATVEDADTGTSLDAAASIDEGLDAADAASVIDAATLITVLAAADTATCDATSTLSVAVSDSDTGSAAETAAFTVAVTAADTVTVVETATVRTERDATITTGPLARGWSAGSPARGWSAGGLSH